MAPVGPGDGGAAGAAGAATGAAAAGPVRPARSTPDGQLLLPLDGLTRRRNTPRRRCPSRHPAAGPRGAGPSAALPLDEGDWPENRPVLGADGQYRLPLHTPRSRPAPDPPRLPPRPRRSRAGGRARPAAGRGRQLRLVFDPFPGNRPLRGGQYPLPLEG